jgi:DNA-binding NarL/FixJ family response regulator
MEPYEQLTGREWQVLALIVEGKSNKVISQDLGIAKSTVETHQRHIFRKLGVRNRTQAAIFAVRQSAMGEISRNPGFPGRQSE